MDFAIQCSPDHPWVLAHPEWFYHRPDGSIKCAENPPYLYQDIYPMNFDSKDWKALWAAWRDIIIFWVDQGVTLFRVDNPHTKPFVFWEWLIREVQADYPDVIFLAEAFTRPKVMKALSKVGFTQSYTYFIWRGGKFELMDYIRELAFSGMEYYFRPNFFTTTPDILPKGLQTGGRPAFKIRLILAALLSPSYGITSGYELCENEAVPGSEEYLDSEKYQIKVRDWKKPGNIIDFITTINTIRRENAALDELSNVQFFSIENNQILLFCKKTKDLSNVLIIAVNLDPHNAQSGTVVIPLHEVGVRPGGSFDVKDLVTGATFTWGEKNFIQLNPQGEPAHILRIERRN